MTQSTTGLDPQEIKKRFQSVKLILLDMDGVLTSEESYWDATGLTIREVLESPAYLGIINGITNTDANSFCLSMADSGRQEWRKYLPREVITKCKIQGINSNWDLAYFVLGLHLIPYLVKLLPLFQNQKESAFYETHFAHFSESALQRLNHEASNQYSPEFLSLDEFPYWSKVIHELDDVPIIEPLTLFAEIGKNAKGLDLHLELNHLLETRSNIPVQLFSRSSRLWEQCKDLFQTWYLGEELYEKQNGKRPSHHPKPGLIHGEQPLHGLSQTKELLQQLTGCGYELGIATGRPKMEILEPLRHWDLLRFFNSNRIVTYDEVHHFEIRLREQGELIRIGKPHPFAFLKAMFPEKQDEELLKINNTNMPNPEQYLIVGDAQADIWAAREIGCHSAGLLSGAIGESARNELETCQPDVICKDLTELISLLCK